MTFTSFLYQLLVASMILPAISLFISEISFPKDNIYLFATLFLYAVAILIHENILTFFTIQKVFLTRVVTIMILCTGFLVFAEATIPGVTINEMSIVRDTLGKIIIANQDMSKYVTMLVVSLITGLVFFMLKELNKKA